MCIFYNEILLKSFGIRKIIFPFELYNSTSTRQACTPTGHLFLYGPPQNKLPFEGNPNSSFSWPLRAMAYPCLDNVHFRGECTLGRLGPKGQGATICNNATSQNRHSWVYNDSSISSPTLGAALFCLRKEDRKMA